MFLNRGAESARRARLFPQHAHAQSSPAARLLKQTHRPRTNPFVSEPTLGNNNTKIRPPRQIWGFSQIRRFQKILRDWGDPAGSHPGSRLSSSSPTFASAQGSHVRSRDVVVFGSVVHRTGERNRGVAQRQANNCTVGGRNLVETAGPRANQDLRDYRPPVANWFGSSSCPASPSRADHV